MDQPPPPSRKGKEPVPPPPPSVQEVPATPFDTPPPTPPPPQPDCYDSDSVEEFVPSTPPSTPPASSTPPPPTSQVAAGHIPIVVYDDMWEDSSFVDEAVEIMDKFIASHVPKPTIVVKQEPPEED